jgi:hypothetical protein
MKIRHYLHQWLLPKEFRIKKSIWSPELIKDLEKSILDSASKPSSILDKGQIGTLADVGTGLWRLRQKMVVPGTEKPLEEMRRAYRHLEFTLDALARTNIRIQDHTGEMVPEGGISKLKVLAYQPHPGIEHKQVQETIKPTIYYMDQMIQMGEVIVSVPEENAS